MPIFYYHPTNEIPQKLSEMTNQRGFLYQNRGVLELMLQRQLADAGYLIHPCFYTVISSVGNSIEHYIDLNPDNEFDRHTIKVCQQKAPWNYVKILNGTDMMFVIGYVSAGGNAPMSMSPTQMAQRGIINTNYVPRPIG